jgi:hypothetical protein
MQRVLSTVLGAECCFIKHGVRAIKGIRPLSGVDITPKQTANQAKFTKNKTNFVHKILENAVAKDEAGELPVLVQHLRNANPTSKNH